MVADDHSIFRAGLKALCSAMAGTAIIADTGNGREALDLVNTHRPDIVLLDIGLPGLNGLEVTRRLKHEFPETKVLILSMHSSAEYVARALHAGASGYVLKEAALEELESALTSIRRNQTYLSPAIARHVIDHYLEVLEDHAGPSDQLTDRQREILVLIAEGRSTRDIARQLDVSVKTVETHRMHIMERLQIFDLAGLVRFAVRCGLVSQTG